METEETKLAALRASLLEGEQSGVTESFTIDEFIARKRSVKAKVK